MVHNHLLSFSSTFFLLVLCSCQRSCSYTSLPYLYIRHLSSDFFLQSQTTVKLYSGFFSVCDPINVLLFNCWLFCMSETNKTNWWFATSPYLIDTTLFRSWFLCIFPWAVCIEYTRFFYSRQENEVPKPILQIQGSQGVAIFFAGLQDCILTIR